MDPLRVEFKHRRIPARLADRAKINFTKTVYLHCTNYL